MSVESLLKTRLARSFLDLCKDRIDHPGLFSIKGRVKINTDKQPFCISVEGGHTNTAICTNGPECAIPDDNSVEAFGCRQSIMDLCGDIVRLTQQAKLHSTVMKAYLELNIDDQSPIYIIIHGNQFDQDSQLEFSASVKPFNDAAQSDQKGSFTEQKKQDLGVCELNIKEPRPRSVVGFGKRDSTRICVFEQNIRQSCPRSVIGFDTRDRTAIRDGIVMESEPAHTPDKHEDTTHEVEIVNNIKYETKMQGNTETIQCFVKCERTEESVLQEDTNGGSLFDTSVINGSDSLAVKDGSDGISSTGTESSIPLDMLGAKSETPLRWETETLQTLVDRAVHETYNDSSETAVICEGESLQTLINRAVSRTYTTAGKRLRKSRKDKWVVRLKEGNKIVLTRVKKPIYT